MTIGIIRRVDNVGRIVIPKQIREHNNINPNDKVSFIIDEINKTIHLKPILDNDNKEIHMDDLIRKEDALKKLYDLKEQINNNTHPLNYGTILEIINDIRYMNKVDENKTPIYTVMTCTDIKSTDKGFGVDFGCTNLVGYFKSKDVTFGLVRENACDINETCYDYALIEEVYPGFYEPAINRWWFKYDIKNDKYNEIEEPDIIKQSHLCGFTIG